MAIKKIFPIWADKEEIDLWKDEAKIDRRSTNQFIIKAIEEKIKKKKTNKKGQFQPFYLLMIAIILFILGFALAPSLTISSAGISSDMNCSNTSISTDDKVTCTVIDLIAPTIIGLVFAFGGMALFARFVL